MRRRCFFSRQLIPPLVSWHCWRAASGLRCETGFFHAALRGSHTSAWTSSNIPRFPGPAVHSDVTRMYIQINIPRTTTQDQTPEPSVSCACTQGSMPTPPRVNLPLPRAALQQHLHAAVHAAACRGQPRLTRWHGCVTDGAASATTTPSAAGQATTTPSAAAAAAARCLFQGAQPCH